VLMGVRFAAVFFSLVRFFLVVLVAISEVYHRQMGAH